MLARFKKFIRISFIIANIGSIILYLLACLVPFIDAGKSWFIAMMGLLFPMLLLILFIFLVYWTIRRSKWAWVSGIALLLGWKQVSVMFAFHFPKKFETGKSPGTIRVMTWNLSSWGESNRSDGGKANHQKEMIDVIKSTNADVLCFEEYVYYKDSKYRDSILPELKEAGYNYCYFTRTKVLERFYKSTRLITTIIISKYPVSDTSHFFYTDAQLAEPLIQADIHVSNKTIRIFTTHLESVRFESTDFQALRNLKEPVKASLGPSKLIAYKLRNAYQTRAAQAGILSEKIKASPHPVIVCGDFNDVPNSYTYFTVKGKLQDAFIKKGSGLGRTLRMISPTLRIDYILADRRFRVTRCNVLNTPYSEHNPVVADLALPED